MLRFHRNYPDSKRPRNKAQLLCCNNVNNTALQLFRSTPSKVSHKVLVGYPLTAMRRQRPRPRTKADTQNSAIPACLALFSERHPLAELSRFFSAVSDRRMGVGSLGETFLDGHIGEKTGEFLHCPRVYLRAEGDVEEDEPRTRLQELLE